MGMHRFPNPSLSHHPALYPSMIRTRTLLFCFDCHKLGSSRISPLGRQSLEELYAVVVE